MKAIFWKEIRENLKWGALGFIVFSLALALAWTKTINPSGQTDESTSYLLSSAILMATSLCPVILAGALGFLQIVPEQRRDRWAFLVHRPVERGAIFWGKAAAGMSLYFAAMLVPWAVMCWVASMPGHAAGPFDWRMSLAGTADILAGSLFYFAGIITALRQARWLGSKWLALAGAAWADSAVTGATHFSAACGWIAVMGIALAVAARGNFLRNGITSSQPAISSAAQFVVFTLGMLTLTQFATEFTKSVASGGRGNPAVTGDYRINNDGELVKIVIAGSEVRRIEDLNGNDLHIPREELTRYLADMPRRVEFGIDDRDHEQVAYRYYNRYFEPAGGAAGEVWFYVRSKRMLEGYDTENRALLGYLAPDGYHPASMGEPASRFSQEFPTGQYQSSFDRVELDGTRLYWVDYVGLHVRQLAELQDPLDYRGGITMAPSRAAYNADSKFTGAVALKDGIYFYQSADATPLFHVPYARDIGTWSAISVAMIGNGQHYMVEYVPTNEEQEKADGKLPVYFYRYSAAGVLEKQWELPALDFVRVKVRWTTYLWSAAIPFGKQLYDAADTWIQKANGSAMAATEWKFLYIRRWPATRLSWLVSVFAGLVCAGIAFWKVRPHGLHGLEMAGWLVFVFFGGLAGLLVFLSLKEWPAHVGCPSCAQKRVVVLENCEHCGAGWKKPVFDGTEIFA